MTSETDHNIWLTHVIVVEQIQIFWQWQLANSYACYTFPPQPVPIHL